MFYIKNKISTKNIDKLLEPHATKEKILVVHSEDIDYAKHFPNAYTVTKRKEVPADMHVDIYYEDLKNIESESYSTIICTGLLEHVPNPQNLINNFNRILKPGGKLVLQASSVFSIHEGPDNFFQFTHFGLETLFREWKGEKKITGSCQPYETIAILLQRILFQVETNIFTKAVTVLLYNILPFFDKTIKKQYTRNGNKKSEYEIDSMLPSNIQIVAFK